MRRREVVLLLAAAATVLPLAAQAAQTMPVIGFVSAAASGSGYAGPIAAFRKGLAESGFVEGRNVTIEYRWADGALDRLPALVADLVARRVNVIVATSTPAALAAKAATTTIPIVFETAADPIPVGLVTSLNRPGGNITGVTQLSVGIVAKDLEVLHEMVPAAHAMALLVNPANAELSAPETKEALAAAKTLGLDLHVIDASAESEFGAAFAKAAQLQAGGLVIGADALFTDRGAELAALAAQHGVPAIYKGRDFAAAGGLASYGLDITKTFSIAGNYAGRILKGDKPGDLPVQQPTDIQMFLNLKTAKALGIAVPLPLLGRADEVFE
jgi:putative ABC transport system substrate-binding protein